MEKTCARCNASKPYDAFHGHKYTLDKRQSHCKDCTKTDKRRRSREKKRTLLEAFGGRCTRCGYDRCDAALEFHHRDPATKSFEIGEVVATYPIDRLMEEAQKCDLVCANCHREIGEALRVCEQRGAV